MQEKRSRQIQRKSGNSSKRSMYILRILNHRIEASFNLMMQHQILTVYFSNLAKRRIGVTEGKTKQSFVGKSSSIRDGICQPWQEESGISRTCSSGKCKIAIMNMNQALILIMFDQYAITIGSSIATRFIA